MSTEVITYITDLGRYLQNCSEMWERERTQAIEARGHVAANSAALVGGYDNWQAVLCGLEGRIEFCQRQLTRTNRELRELSEKAL